MLLVLVAIAIYLGYSYVEQSIRMSKLQQEKAMLEEQKVTLQQEIQDLNRD